MMEHSDNLFILLAYNIFISNLWDGSLTHNTFREKRYIVYNNYYQHDEFRSDVYCMQSFNYEWKKTYNLVIPTIGKNLSLWFKYRFFAPSFAKATDWQVAQNDDSTPLVTERLLMYFFCFPGYGAI